MKAVQKEALSLYNEIRRMMNDIDEIADNLYESGITNENIGSRIWTDIYVYEKSNSISCDSIIVEPKSEVRGIGTEYVGVKIVRRKDYTLYLSMRSIATGGSYHCYVLAISDKQYEAYEQYEAEQDFKAECADMEEEARFYREHPDYL